MLASYGVLFAADDRPNLIFIMTDDHGLGAVSAYGSEINETPNIDRIAEGGMRFNHCFVTASLCAPSRASMLTGTYPHINLQVDIGGNFFDGTQPTFVNLMDAEGYQTAVIGKWHLHSIPMGFDYYSVLEGQGDYFDPEFITKTSIGPVWEQTEGYSTDIITDKSLEWLEERNPEEPFLLLCHFKSPHYNWEPHPRYQDRYTEDLPYPDTFNNTYDGPEAYRFTADVEKAHEFFKIDRWVEEMPKGLTEAEQKKWNYQRFMKDYLRCIAAVDDNVGRILDYLEENDLVDNTIIVYTSDNGMLQGEHGQIDKQLMQEQSIHIPFLIRFPAEIPAQSESDNFLLNIDFAPTFLDYAGIEIPEVMQGVSARELLAGATPEDWRDSFYYRYYAHYDQERSVWGVRTADWKLINYYKQDSPTIQQLFDLNNDPQEINNLANNPEFSSIKASLDQQIDLLQAEYGLTDGLIEQIYAKPGELISMPRMRKEVRELRKEIDENTEAFAKMTE